MVRVVDRSLTGSARRLDVDHTSYGKPSTPDEIGDIPARIRGDAHHHGEVRPVPDLRGCRSERDSCRAHITRPVPERHGQPRGAGECGAGGEPYGKPEGP